MNIDECLRVCLLADRESGYVFGTHIDRGSVNPVELFRRALKDAVKSAGAFPSEIEIPEGDYVALGPGGEKWAMEVKSSFPEERELVGLRRFIEEHSAFEPVLVSPGGGSISGIKHVDLKEVLSFNREQPGQLVTSPG